METGGRNTLKSTSRQPQREEYPMHRFLIIREKAGDNYPAYSSDALPPVQHNKRLRSECTRLSSSIVRVFPRMASPFPSRNPMHPTEQCRNEFLQGVSPFSALSENGLSVFGLVALCFPMICSDSNGRETCRSNFPGIYAIGTKKKYFPPDMQGFGQDILIKRSPRIHT